MQARTCVREKADLSSLGLLFTGLSHTQVHKNNCLQLEGASELLAGVSSTQFPIPQAQAAARNLHQLPGDVAAALKNSLEETKPKGSSPILWNCVHVYH